MLLLSFVAQEQYEFMYRALYEGVSVGQTTLTLKEFSPFHKHADRDNRLRKQLEVSAALYFPQTLWPATEIVKVTSHYFNLNVCKWRRQCYTIPVL
jgi:hypothetical protein